MVGDLKGIRENKGNDNYDLKLGQWPYEKFIQLLSYKAEERGIKVVTVDESQTSQKCSSCDVVDPSNRVERGLFRCSNCGHTVNADVNGAVNILKKVTTLRGSNGSVAEPAVNLFAVRSGIRADGSEEGTFHTMEQLQTLRDQKRSPFL
ncbi:MAG: IS200/IS605 family element transposase accessory protein TnpB [Candidatus Korarchaeota archaeon]|nr:IS200/IS605 family element transposase accessory protein TnpB [Candidatus Korarchaeota archaeon]NIU85574.1 IS200/IS605 family element transposase accessory protein TnpB [Candidatus Thorarchaeota archaeon]NIW15118.1 IS200/IS605 family element transposase accessory protein TnpB [Candidatus Thorarchaeota archaeon]NIW53123.1 IS200/IS605 family element transposase accessory protein TnpB [Candidatus Korarchaeota archaeon]